MIGKKVNRIDLHSVPVAGVPKRVALKRVGYWKSRWLVFLCGVACGAEFLIDRPSMARMPASVPEGASPEVQGATQGGQTKTIGSSDGLLDGLDLGLPAEQVVPREEPGDSGPRTGSRIGGGNGPGERDNGSRRVTGEVEGIAALLGEARDEMRAAGRLLAEDEFGEPAQRHQRRVVELIDALLEAAGAGQSQRGATEAGSTGKSGETSSGEGEKIDSEPSVDRQREPQESSQQPGGAEGQESRASGQAGGEEGEGSLGDGIRSEAASNVVGTARPLDMQGEAVWGHLPEQRRGLLRAETPTEYLPKYAEQISRYFEALARLAEREGGR